MSGERPLAARVQAVQAEPNIATSSARRGRLSAVFYIMGHRLSSHGGRRVPTTLVFPKDPS